MKKALALATFVAGLVLLYFGLNAQDSVLSNAKEAVTGTPTDQSLWLTVLGAGCIIVGGLVALYRQSRH